MSLASEFKEFAMKGNVVDLAVGVIIGAAFGKIVSSLVGDMFMPTLGKLIGGFNFSDLAIGLGKDPTGKDVLIKYGAFIQTIFDFLIIAPGAFVDGTKLPVVVAPSNKGIVLFRTLINDDEHVAEIDAARRHAACEPYRAPRP